MLPALPLQNGGAGLVLLLWLVITAAFLALTYFVYEDAQRNSQQPAFLWAIVVFLAPLFRLILYVLLGRNGGGRGGPPSSKV